MQHMRPLLLMREHFNEPERLGPVWTLTKGRRTADCRLWSHQFGFELRLIISDDDLPRTQVVCSQEDLIRMQEQWPRRSRRRAGRSKSGRAHDASGDLPRPRPWVDGGPRESIRVAPALCPPRL